MDDYHGPLYEQYREAFVRALAPGDQERLKAAMLGQVLQPSGQELLQRDYAGYLATGCVREASAARVEATRRPVPKRAFWLARCSVDGVFCGACLGLRLCFAAFVLLLVATIFTIAATAS